MSQTNPIISIPKNNPIRLYKDVQELPFALSQPSWYEQKKYCQQFWRFDELAFQVKVENDQGWGNVVGCTIYVYNIDGNQTYTVAMSYIDNIAGYSYFEFRKILNILSKGFYQIKLNVTISDGSVIISNVDFYSEPIEILNSTELANTLLIKYTSDNNNSGLMFVNPSTPTTTYQFQHRVFGGFKIEDHTPGSKDVAYTNQEYNITTLDSKPFEVDVLTIGNCQGIPNYQMDIINRIFSCSEFLIDDVLWVKNDGAKLEKKSEPNYPMLGWSIELIKGGGENDNSYGGPDYNGDYSDDFSI